MNNNNIQTKIPFVFKLFLPLTPVLFFLIFFFHLIDFLPHEIFDWLNVFLDREDVAFYFSPLFIYLFLSFIIVFTWLVIFFESIYVFLQNKISFDFRKTLIISMNSLSIFLILYFIEIVFVFFVIIILGQYSFFLNLLNSNLLDVLIKLLKYMHIFIASLILIYNQFFLPIYVKTKRLKISLKIFFRRLRSSFFYPINIALYLIFVYSSIELFYLLIGSNLKYYINNSEIFLFYKSQISTMKNIHDVFLSFGYFALIIILNIILFIPIYNVFYLFGRNLMMKSMKKI